jgi:hypothetical protein
VLLGQLDGVSDVVVMSVRERDHVDALRLLLGSGALRIAVQERVDVDAFAAGRLDAERRVTQPGEGSAHAARLTNGALSRQRHVRGAGGAGGAGRTVRSGGEGVSVGRSAISAALVLGAVVADGGHARALALYLVLAAIPAVAVTALSFFGDLAEGSADSDAGAVYVGLTSLALVLLVIGAAVRSNAVAHSPVPALGVSTLVGALALLGLQLAVWASLRLSRERPVKVTHSAASDV